LSTDRVANLQRAMQLIADAVEDPPAECRDLAATRPELPRHCWRLFKILRDAICVAITGAFLPDGIIKHACRLARLLFEPSRRKRTRRAFPCFVTS